MAVVFFVLIVVAVINVESAPFSSDYQWHVKGNEHTQYTTTTPLTTQTDSTNVLKHPVIVDTKISNQNNGATFNIGNGHNSQNNVVVSEGTEHKPEVIHAQTASHSDDDNDEGIYINSKPNGPREYDIGNGRSNRNIVVIGDNVYENGVLTSRSGTTDNFEGQDQRNGYGAYGPTRQIPTTETHNSGETQHAVDVIGDPNSNGYSLNIGNGYYRKNNVVLSHGAGNDQVQVHAQTFNGSPLDTQSKTFSYGNNDDGTHIIRGYEGSSSINIGNGGYNGEGLSIIRGPDGRSSINIGNGGCNGEGLSITRGPGGRSSINIGNGGCNDEGLSITRKSEGRGSINIGNGGYNDQELSVSRGSGGRSSINIGNGGYNNQDVTITRGSGSRSSMNIKNGAHSNKGKFYTNGHDGTSAVNTNNGVHSDEKNVISRPEGTNGINIGNGETNTNSVVVDQTERPAPETSFQLRGGFKDSENKSDKVNDPVSNILVGRGKGNENHVYSDA